MSPESSPSKAGPGQGPAKAIKTNLILALALIVLSSLAYWYEFRKKGQLERAEEAKTRLISVDQNREVESIQIIDKEKEVEVQMRCKEHCKLNDPGAYWEITSPVQFKADESNVGTFITSVGAAKIQETLMLDGDVEGRLKDYGLGKDQRGRLQAAIKFKIDPEPYLISIGDNSAVGENVYVYLQGPGQPLNAVRIVPGHLKTSVQRDLDYWRSKRLFNFAASEIEGVSLKNPAGQTVLQRESGNWFLAGAGKTMADNEAVDTFLTGLVFMNAHSYVSDNKAKDFSKFKMVKPTYELKLKFAKNPETKLDVYDVLLEKQPKLYATLNGKNFIVELDRTNAEKFTKKSDAFRFHNLISAAEKQETQKLEVRFGGANKVTFTLDGPNWKLESGKIESFEPVSVDQALTKLGAARIAEFLGNKKASKDNPELTQWALTTKDGKLLRQFTFYGSVEKGDYYVALPTGELAKLERGSGSAVPNKIADFQKAAVSPASPLVQPRPQDAEAPHQ